MKTVLAGIAVSIAAVALGIITIGRAPGEKSTASAAETSRSTRPSAAHRSERSRMVPSGNDVPAGPDFSSRRTAGTTSSRIWSPEKIAAPAGSTAIVKEDGSTDDSPALLPRETREDISLATVSKHRTQARRSPFALRAERLRAEEISASGDDTGTSAGTDAGAATTTDPTTPFTQLPPRTNDEDFRYRQIYGQHAWMTRHIGLHNGTASEKTDNSAR